MASSWWWKRRADDLLGVPRLCGSCGTVTSDFSPGNTHCRPCRRPYNAAKGREYKARDPYKAAQRARKHAFGLTSEEFDDLVKLSGGKCDVCQLVTPDLVIDHCHSTGVVRGMLCRACNVALGLIHDDPETLKLMILYLANFNNPLELVMREKD